MFVTAFQPAKPRRRRVRAHEAPASPPPPPPPPPSVSVVSVTALGAFLADWEFSGPVMLSGNAAPELEIDGEGLGFIGPDFVDQVGAAIIRADYSSASGVAAGDAWRVLSAPAGIAPGVLVPAGGNVG